jgi:hypothetical protein
MSLQMATHSSQMNTPGPAISFSTRSLDFPQNEHRIVPFTNFAGAVRLPAPIAPPVRPHDPDSSARHAWSHVARRPNMTIPTPVPPAHSAPGHRAPHHDQWPDRSRFDPTRSVLDTSADSLGKGHRAVVVGQLKTRSWETSEGDKRSVTELEAEEIGASLKWATAKVERTSQRGNGERSQGRERQAERGSDFNDQPPF